MALLRSYRLFILTTFHLLRNKKRWQKEAQYYTKPLLERYKVNHNLPKSVLLKIRDYGFEGLYGTYVLADLQGIKLTADEKEKAVYTGMLLAVGDILCDDLRGHEDHLEAMLRAPFTAKPTSGLESLLEEVYGHILQRLEAEKKKSFCAILLEGFRLEKAGLVTPSAEFDLDWFDRLHQEKGAMSLLLYQQVLKANTEPQLEAVLRNTGAFINCIDDLFDMKQDADAGHASGLNHLPNWHQVQNRLTERYEAIEKALSAAALPKKNKQQFQFLFFFFLLGCSSYINQMKRKLGPELSLNAIRSWHSADTKFTYVTWANAAYMMRNVARFTR